MQGLNFFKLLVEAILWKREKKTEHLTETLISIYKEKHTNKLPTFLIHNH